MRNQDESGMLPDFNQCVIHPGPAHRDEFLSVGMARYFGLINETSSVSRREPVPGDLEDPHTLVLDCGKSLEPARGNFDHHQKGMEGQCTMTLLAEYLGIDKILAVEPWYERTAQLDSLGPFNTAKEMGLEKFPFSLLSPIEKGLLRLWAQEEYLTHYMVEASAAIFEQLYLDAKAKADDLDWLDNHVKVIDIEGLLVGYIPDFTGTPTNVSVWMDRHETNFAIAVNPAARGNGLAMFRIENNPAVDFTRISDRDEVGFAHPGGFLATTKEPVEWAVVEDLIRASLV